MKRTLEIFRGDYSYVQAKQYGAIESLTLISESNSLREGEAANAVDAIKVALSVLGNSIDDLNFVLRDEDHNLLDFV